MVIRKMNNMFNRHGRWIFAVITLFIIISFVGFLTPGFSSMFGGGGGRGGSAGTAFGRNISFSEVHDQAMRDAIIIALTYNVELNSSQVFDAAEQNAFYSICILRAADRLGVAVSDDEVAAFIEKMPRFAGSDNKFSVSKYREFVDGSLKRVGFSATMLEEAVRDSIRKRKLMDMVTGEVIASENEVRDFFYMLREKYQVSLAEFRGADFAGKVKISDDDARAFFESNRGSYMIPDRFRVWTVEFDYDSFAEPAGKMITGAEIENYYKRNKQEFSMEENGRSEVTPLDKVAAEIKTRLAADKTRELALQSAQQLAEKAYRLTQDSKEAGAVFRRLALEAGKPVIVHDWLDRNTRKLGSRPMEPEVLDELDGMSGVSPVSNPVTGEKCVYIIFMEQREDARPAQFEEVREQVSNDLRFRRAVAMAREQARQAAVEISRSGDQKKAFVELVPAAKEIEEFDAMNPPYIPTGNIIAALSEQVAEGNISEVRDTPDGALFVLVKTRTLPSEADFEQVKTFLASFYTRMKQESAGNNFSQWLQSKCKMYEPKGN